MGFKLFYPDRRLNAEAARMLFHISGEKYENITWTADEWQNGRKNESPTGKAPWLEVDGHVIPESFAIYRFLANRFGLAGKDEFEKALVDSTADFFRDTVDPMWDYFFVICGVENGDKDELYKKNIVPVVGKAFDYVEKLVNKSGSGFIAASGITWADLYIAENVVYFCYMMPNFPDLCPFAVEYQNRVHNHPKIKEYADSRKHVKPGNMTPVNK